MLSLRITQHPAVNLDPKQLLRAHIDQLPVEKQLEFVDLALHLIENRPVTRKGKARAETRLVN